MLKEALQFLIGLAPVQESGRVAFVPDDHNVVDLEQYRPYPSRIRQKPVLTGIDTFTAYVNRFKNATSTLFVVPDLSALSKNATLASAILDYHMRATPADAGAAWGDHVATLRASPSLAYGKLLDIDTKLLPQDEFAKKIEELARFCTSHAAGELLEIARTLSLTSKGDYKTFDDELSGSVDFVYDVQVKANAGTSERRLTVPQELLFDVPLIDGMEATVVATKFLYRVPGDPGGKVQLGLKIVDRAWIEKAAIDAVAAKLRADCGVDVFCGAL